MLPQYFCKILACKLAPLANASRDFEAPSYQDALNKLCETIMSMDLRGQGASIVEHLRSRVGEADYLGFLENSSLALLVMELEWYGYSVRKAPDFYPDDNTCISMLVPVSITGTHTFQGVMSGTHTRSTFTPITSPSLDLLIYYYEQGKFNSHAWDTADLLSVLPHGKKLGLEIQGNPGHALATWYQTLPAPSKKNWDTTWDTLAQDLQDFNRLVKCADEYQDWFTDPRVEQYHYALFHAPDPSVAFFMLLDLHRRSSGELQQILNTALGPIAARLFFEYRDNAARSLFSGPGREAVEVSFSAQNCSNEFINLSQIPYPELVQRITLALQRNPNGIPGALQGLYMNDAAAFAPDERIWHIEAWQDTDHEHIVREQGLLDIEDALTPAPELPIKKLLRFRPRWTALTEETRRADANGNGTLSRTEFLAAEFSDPVEAFIRHKLNKHPTLTTALMSWERFATGQDVSQKTGTETASWTRLKQQDKTGRAGLLEANRNLDLLPCKALIKMIQLATDRDLRLDAWTVFAHQYPSEALALWKTIFDLWEAELPLGKRLIDWVDILTPLQYLGGRLDVDLTLYLPRLQAQMDSKKLPDESRTLFKTLWTQSPEIVPWELLQHVFDQIESELRALPDYQTTQGATTPHDALNDIIQIRWLQYLITDLGHALTLGAHIEPKVMQQELRALDQIEDWQADLVVLALYGNAANLNATERGALIARSIEVASALCQQDNRAIQKDVFTWLGVLARSFKGQEISLTEMQINQLTGLFEAYNYLLRDRDSGSLFPLAELLWQHRSFSAVRALFCKNLFQGPGAWIFQTLLFQLVFLEKDGLPVTAKVDQLVADLGISYEQMAFLLTQALEHLLAGEGTETSVSTQTLQDAGLEAMQLCLEHCHLEDPVVMQTLVALFRHKPPEGNDADDSNWFQEPQDKYDETGLNVMALLLLSCAPDSLEGFLTQIPADIDRNKLARSRDWNKNILERLGLHLADRLPDQRPDRAIALYLAHPIAGAAVDSYMNPVAFFANPAATLTRTFEQLNPFFNRYVPASNTSSNQTGLDQIAVQGEDGYIDRYQDYSWNLPQLTRMTLLGIDEGVWSANELQTMNESLNAIRSSADLAPLTQAYVELLLAVTGNKQEADKMARLYLSKTDKKALHKSLHTLENATNQDQLWWHSNPSDFEMFLQQVGLFLAYTNPELLFGGNALPTTRTKRQGGDMAMIENGFVETGMNGLGEVVLRDLGLTEAEASAHATWVAQVMFGNTKTVNTANDGTLYSYAIDFENDIWNQLATCLDDMLTQITDGAKIDVINLSFGAIMPLLSKGAFEAFESNPAFVRCQDLVAKLSSKGVLLVAAAGNAGDGFGKSFLGTPLGLSNVLGLLGNNMVLAGSWEFDPNAPAGEQHKTAPYSARGGAVSGPTLLAPGSNYTFWTNKPSHLSKDIDGTSFAAPYTARIIHWMHRINPFLSGDKIVEILKASAEGLGTQLPEDQGAGKLMASRCFFMAWAMRPEIHTRKRTQALARELGVEHEVRELRWLSRQI